MATKYVKFDAADGAAAEAYSALVDQALGDISPALVPWAARYTEDMGPEMPAGSLRRDKSLNYVVAWYGPPFVFNGATVSAVTGDDAGRALGVLADTPDWLDG